MKAPQPGQVFRSGVITSSRSGRARAVVLAIPHLHRCRDHNAIEAGSANFASLEKKLADAVVEEAAAHPGVPVEVFCTDEHRLGLKPVLRSVWALKGQRPTALGHHRFQWLYVTAFVGPATGETVWYLTDTMSKPLFVALLAAFANEVGAGPSKRIVLLLDNAGFYTRPNLAVPDGIRLVYLPPYSPELQPAETLWTLVDEPIVNKLVPSLDQLKDTIGERCRYLTERRTEISSRTKFAW